PSFCSTDPLSLVATCPPPPSCSLSLHDALPIYPLLRRSLVTRSFTRRFAAAFIIGAVSVALVACGGDDDSAEASLTWDAQSLQQDRKSTRLNSSHVKISYAVFCLKKKYDQPHTP